MNKNDKIHIKKGNTKQLLNTFKTVNLIYNTMNSGIFKAITNRSIEFLKNHYSRSFKLFNNNNLVNNIYDLINKINPKITSCYNTNEGPRIINRSFSIKLDYYTIAFFNVGSSIKEYNYENSNMCDWSLELIIAGKNFHKYADMIKEVLNMEDSNLTQYEVTGSDRGLGYSSTFSNAMTERKLNTLFFQDNEIDKITNHINKFLNQKELYMKRGLLYKTGIILEGEPGTGKSSMVRALASEYHFNLVTIDLSTIRNINLINVAKSINADKSHKMYIVLLEDIDCILNLNRYSSNTDEEKNISDERPEQIQNDVINKLLNFLDGTDSPTNTIFIATTNFYSKLKNSKKALDKALVRAGRIDQVFHIAGIDKHNASLMCSSFGLSTTEIDELLENEEFPINQSYLQGKILYDINKDM